MKNNKIFRILGIVIVLSLLVAAMPATPALAAPRVNVSPTEGEIGDRIDITGYGFSVNTTVRIYFSNQAASEGDYIDSEVTAYERVKTPNIDEWGILDSYFYVPTSLNDGDDVENVHGGQYYVYATYSGSTRIRATDDFTVIGGEIELYPTEGHTGTEVEVTGIDFGEREDITIEYNDEDLDIASGDEETDSDGEFTCTIIIPESVAGDHTITVTDEAGTEAEAVFTVEPQITIIPTSGAAGTTVTVSGTGFDYRSDVTTYLNNTEVATETTNRYGSFEVTFNVPVLGPGIYDVEAEDEDDNKDRVEFTIAASASLSQTSGYVGTEVTVSGTGFEANMPISITFAGVGVGTTDSDDKGSFTTSFNVPASATGTHEVKVSDGLNTEETDFTVLTSASISPVTSTASPGHVGTELTISGIGYIAGRTVTIEYDATQVTTATVKTDGTFSAAFEVPASRYGEHNMTATDGTMTNQFTFTMESTAPPKPVLLEPEMDVKDKAAAYFDWGDVTDPSSVTYTLQIASDEDFTSIMLEKKNLTDSESTTTKEERLKSVSKKTPYYWRVKAIDGASNESRWSGARSFYVGFSLTMPQWAIYTLFGIGALLFGFFGFWVGRKTAYSSY